MTQKEKYGFITELTTGIEVIDSNNRIVGIYDKIIL